MLLTEKMKQDLFSQAEAEIIKYMFEQRENIEDQTAKQIAESTYTHPSTLIRIAKKLGYSGWIEMKNIFLEEIDYLNSHFQDIDANYPFDANDNVMTVASKMATLNQITISDTLSLIDHNELQQVSALLNRSSQIKIFSQYNNLLLCYDFKSKMIKIGKQINLCVGDAYDEAMNCDADTCAIVISYTGETNDVTGVLPVLRKQNTPIIALTSIGENTLSRHADYVFRITTREKLYSKIGSFTSSNSITYLLDVLYASVFSVDYEKNLANKIRVSEHSDHRKSSNEVMEEGKGSPLSR
ncbi:MurR/RpiR family transcriptional regulator [Paraliobacillus salinarum]|uniref:MurR/RpiR family transcriptional regulator n=1 Tax=Paraliobacillus salinarum TaxID=1158996 RepID=UPI0015F3FC16|nr:MurR/RpiR family transcriptional regulator [Paraliobacillus salinarum]